MGWDNLNLVSTIYLVWSLTFSWWSTNCESYLVIFIIIIIIIISRLSYISDWKATPKYIYDLISSFSS